MQAVAIREFGSPEVLRLVDLDTPVPGPGQVRVRVRAAGVQPVDLAVREGFRLPGSDPVFPIVIGNEFAGTVDALGDGVHAVAGVAVGDEVIGWSMLRCYAEYVVVDAGQVVPKPPTMPWAEAGVLSASGQTAHTALEALGIGPGETVLIHAAAGGVGTMAVQLARARGATVIGTASPRNHDYLRSLGAIPVAYGEGLVERVRAAAPDGVDAAIDAVGGAAIDASVALVADRSRIGTIVAFDRIDELGIRPIRSQRSQQRLAELTGLWEAGKLRVSIWREFPLAEAAAAHREVETGHVRGKVVLIID